jgi:hypothetical protein
MNKSQRASEPQSKSQMNSNILSLMAQVSNIRKEINPTVQLSGQRVLAAGGGTKIPLRRNLNCNLTASASNNIVVTGTLLATAGIPDGARILGFKVTNRTGRRVVVGIPVDSGLCYFGPNGSPSTVTKEVWAPLSRFPTLNVNVPDVIANTIDTNNSSTSLFTIGGFGSSTNDTFTVTFHYIDYV